MTQHHYLAKVVPAIICCLICSSGARADETPKKLELDDAQLDQITAGAASASDEETIFSIVRTTRSGNTISADGALKVLNADELLSAGRLTLTDYAQQNLRSIVNINAVNADVNVLLNLNVTIDSAVGTVNQFNVNGTLLGVPPAIIDK